MIDVARVMALPIAQQLLCDEPVLHLSYTARDGGPRVIPIGYLWDGGSFRMWTVPGSAKVGALQADPRVAVTIDIPGRRRGCCWSGPGRACHRRRRAGRLPAGFAPHDAARGMGRLRRTGPCAL